MGISSEYQETIDYLFAQLPMYQRTGKEAFKKDLSNIKALLDHLDHPERGIRFVHVAGTNGKGTVSHMIAAMLQAAGYRTGLYTSPHYVDFRERVKVNGVLIEPDFVVRFTKWMKEEMQRINPSFFEISVAMALSYFRDMEVDMAVIETGLGGRLDSTNVVDPVMSVITNISLDHMDMLGDSIYAISCEKAGIIKDLRPVVIGRYQKECDEVFFFKAALMEAPLRFASLRWRVDRRNNQFFFEGKRGCKHHVPMDFPSSPFLAENAITALETVHWMKELDVLAIDEEAIQAGLIQFKELTRYIGRWQVLGRAPLILTDSAHNYEAVKSVINWIVQSGFANLHLVVGFVADKDLKSIFEILPSSANYYFVAADVPRALPADRLQKFAQEYGLRGAAYSSVEKGFAAAVDGAGKEDLVYIGGSSFVVAEVL